jgi:type III pantothenate kinase
VDSFLGIDIGNTNIKVGLWQQDRWQSIWRMQTLPDNLPDDYAALLGDFLNNQSIHAAAIASVVPSLTGIFVEIIHRTFGIAPMDVTARLKTGIQIDVDHPERVGADRIVNAAAAYALYGSPAIVVDFGTATKFEVISRQGVYSGGSIAPGIGISLDALVGQTALLSRVAIQPPPLAVPRNTTHSIQGGLFWGYVGLFEGIIARLRASMDDGSNATVIATGGFAGLFKEHTIAIQYIAPTLTLDGLRLIHSLNIE